MSSLEFSFCDLGKYRCVEWQKLPSAVPQAVCFSSRWKLETCASCGPVCNGTFGMTLEHGPWPTSSGYYCLFIVTGFAAVVVLRCWRLQFLGFPAHGGGARSMATQSLNSFMLFGFPMFSWCPNWQEEAAASKTRRLFTEAKSWQSW